MSRMNRRGFLKLTGGMAAAAAVTRKLKFAEEPVVTRVNEERGDDLSALVWIRIEVFSFEPPDLFSENGRIDLDHYGEFLLTTPGATLLNRKTVMPIRVAQGDTLEVAYRLEVE